MDYGFQGLSTLYNRESLGRWSDTRCTLCCLTPRCFPRCPDLRPAETIVFQVSIDESIRMVNVVTHDARL